MVSRFFFFINLLLLSAALAHPLSRRDEDSRPYYNEDWAGDGLVDSNGTFNHVTGTITVPTLSGSDGFAYADVGIDGLSCTNVTLQAGVEFTMSKGKASYNAWYQWYPSYFSYLPDLQISAGNVITFTVTAYSTTSGSVVIENLTNGNRVTKLLTSSNPLCQHDVEWVVEAPVVNGTFDAFADFGTVTFSGATASDASGHTYGPSDAHILEIKRNGVVLTSSHVSQSSVTVSYV